MLERQDLEMIRAIMKEEIAESQEHILAEVDKKLDTSLTGTQEHILAEVDKKLDTRLTGTQEHILTEIDRRLDSRFTESENLILGELDRVQDNLTERLDTMKRRLDEMTEYYRIKKLDDINGAMLLKMIQEVEKRVEALEAKTA